MVSFCFVGFTFARYTSTGSGAASVTVAKWDISSDLTGTTSVDFDKLSPSKDVYVSTARTNKTAVKKVMTITNNSDVAANITIEAGDITLTQLSTPVAGAATYSEENAKKVFSIELYSDAAGNTKLSTNAIEVAAGGTLDVYAAVIWTSDVDTMTGDAADANDTMIAQNVASVEYAITYTAVQASKLPA